MNQYVKEIDKLKDSDDLITSNLKYVLKEAHKWKGYGTPLEDLVQEGNIGLMIASQKYKPELGYKFLTFATFYIKKYIMKAVGENKALVRMPASFQNQSHKINKKIKQYIRENGKEPTTSEIASLTGYSEKVIKKTLVNNVNIQISLDKPIGDKDDGRTLMSVLDTKASDETPLDLIEEQDKYNVLYDRLNELDDRMRKAIELRYLKGYTLARVGKEIGVSTPGASNIINRGLEILRQQGEIE